MKYFNNNQGLTLIELLVAVTIFASSVAVITSITLDMLQIEARSASNQIALDNARFILQRISKALRVSEIKTEDNSPNNDYICIKHPRRDYIRYEFTSNNRVEEILMDGDCTTYTSQRGYLDSEQVDIDNFSFMIEGVDDGTDGRQPKVTLSFKITPPKARQKALPSIVFQTTLSQRGLDLP
jgi:prepilin-type N-terminal cleavage/methylation domain-containing protein